jgi:hypothetical protein
VDLHPNSALKVRADIDSEQANAEKGRREWREAAIESPTRGNYSLFSEKKKGGGSRKAEYCLSSLMTRIPITETQLFSV